MTREKLIEILKKGDVEFFSLKKGGAKSHNEYIADLLIKHKAVKIIEGVVTDDQIRSRTNRRIKDKGTKPLPWGKAKGIEH